MFPLLANTAIAMASVTALCLFFPENSLEKTAYPAGAAQEHGGHELRRYFLAPTKIPVSTIPTRPRTVTPVLPVKTFSTPSSS
jgi:hypothetical protein